MGYTEAKCDELMMMDREQLKVKGQRVTILITKIYFCILDFKGT